MAGSRSSYVADANIWIDLIDGGLLASVRRLPFDCLIPDVVMEELNEGTRQRLKAHGAQEVELLPEQVGDALRMIRLYRSASRIDLFALALAKGRGTILLTGDRHLRDAADREGVEVHGILWVLDRMVEGGIVTATQAADALERMIAQGCRLPEGEVKERLKRWRRE
jgi:predicted nucleic acid-binding protein